MKDKIVLVVIFLERNISEELEVPVDISADELILALNQIYELNLNPERVFSYYLKADNPKVLLQGQRKLKEFGVRNGTILYLEDKDIDACRVLGR